MKKPPPKKASPTPIRWPEDLLIKLKEEAAKENRSLSNMIVTIVRDYFIGKSKK